MYKVNHANPESLERNSLDVIDYTYEELSQIGEDIRNTVFNGMLSVNLEKLHLLGYRKAKVIINENKLAAFLPVKLYLQLKETLKESKIQFRFNESDILFLENNKLQGIKWLARRFYTSSKNLRSLAIKHHIGIPCESHRYSPADDELIRNNLDKSWAWVAKKLGVSTRSAKSRGRKLGLFMNSYYTVLPHQFTAEEDLFIKEHNNIGIKGLERHLKLNHKTIKRRAKELGITITHGYFHNFTEAEEKIIKANARKGIRWLSKHLSLSNEVINRKAKKMGVKIASVRCSKDEVINVRVYTEADEQFIRQNLYKGARYLSDYFKVSQFAIYAKVNNMGMNLSKVYTAEENQFIKDNADKGSKWLAEQLGRSVKSIYHKFSEFKLTKSTSKVARPYTKREDEIIYEWLRQGKGSKRIGKELGRHSGSVHSRIRKLGLRKKLMEESGIELSY